MIALLLSMVVYIALSVLSIFTFGSALKPDLIDNVGEEIDHDFESIVLRAAFAIVIVCHIPYVFFAGKESLLVLIDEIDRRSISSSLDKTLNESRNHNMITAPMSPETHNRHTLAEQLMAYHNMNRVYYYGGTLIVYIIPLILAIIVTDVGIIFQFGAALSGSSV